MLRSRDSLAVRAPAPSLVPWGVSPDADLVYRTLVSFGPAAATDLERSLGMSRRRVVAALDELAAAGAARSGPVAARRGVIWTPRPPGEVIADRRRARLRLVRTGPQEAREPLPLGDDLRHLPSRAATRDRLAELVRIARHEHLAINTEPRFDTESSRSAAPMDRTLISHGVRVRVLGVQPPDRRWLSAPAEKPDVPRPEYREAPSVPMKLIVVDRKVALFPVAPADFSRGYLEVAQPPVVSALVALFERHWETAQPPQEHTLYDIALEPRERSLVELLARGHTDASAARELRISARSVSYILRGLMDRLGVDNRFQLGLALGAMRSAQPHEPAPPPPTTTSGEDN
jgi:DNA-binding CsgD family transcriptional regulator